MPEPIFVSREQVIKCLRGAGWHFKRTGKRTEIWKKKGSTQRTSLPTNKTFSEKSVRVVLSQAGFSADDIECFLRESIKEAGRA